MTVGACGESGGEGQPPSDGVEVGSPRSGTEWIKRIRWNRRRFEAGRRTDTRRARASATLRPKLMEAADMERAAMVSRLRTTAALKRIGRRMRTATLFHQPRDVAFVGRCVKKMLDRMRVSQKKVLLGNACTDAPKNEKVRTVWMSLGKFRSSSARHTPALALPAPAESSRREMSLEGASGATPEEHAAATRLQATFKGHKQRVAFEAQKAHASEFAEYDQATLERSRRMREREERKAMLKDLPASEVEEWYARQEHDAAVVVQSTFRMHMAKRDVARKRLESRSKPRVLAVDPDAADVLAA